jgi:dipeptidyl aminopeptidase/acylaminoacyl peptidase
VDLADNAGASEGSFEQLTISREVEDAAAALEQLAALYDGGISNIGVAGHSFGGLIAMLVAARSGGDVRALAAVSAVFDAPSRFRAMRAERESEFQQRGRLQLGGNPGMALGVAFFEDLERWDVAAEASKVRAPAIVVHGADDDEVDPEHARAYARALAHVRPAERLVEGADHTYTDPRALEEVAVTVAAFFDTALR